MSRRFIPGLVILLPIVIVLSISAQGVGRYNLPIRYSEYDPSQPSVACHQPLQSVVAWAEEGGVWTSFEQLGCTGLPKDIPPYQYDHGPGLRPEVGALLDETSILAFVRGDSLVVRESGWDGPWETVATAYLGTTPTQIAGHIDMWCSPYPHHADQAWLVLWSGSYADGAIRFMQRSAGGWAALETVVIATSDLDYASFPQVTDYDGPSGPLPRIYYNDMGAMTYLMHVDRQFEGDWSEPVAYAGDFMFGGEFDVARSADGYVFLATGPQPACPCNIIYFHEWTETGGWSDAVNMTIHMDYLNWPMSPQIGVDGNDRVHAYWFQEGSNSGLDPHSKVLIYKIRDEGTWNDQSSCLADHQNQGLDSHVSMSLDTQGQAVLTWAQRDTLDGIPQPKGLWMSVYDYCSVGVPEMTPDVLHASASPNPFNPLVTIVVTSRHDVVAVEIFDTRGRRLASLIPTVEDGCWRTQWDGRDETGRAAPSGAYLARARGVAGGTSTCKITLTR